MKEEQDTDTKLQARTNLLRLAYIKPSFYLAYMLQ